MRLNWSIRTGRFAGVSFFDDIGFVIYLLILSSCGRREQEKKVELVYCANR